MARGLTSAVKTELATGGATAIEPVYLLYLGFGTPLYRTNCSFNLTSSVSGSSQTYVADAFFLGVGSMSETTEPIKNTFNVTLSGVDQSIVSVVLAENIINDTVKVWQGLLDSSNALIADPYLLFDGTINRYSIEDDTNSTALGLEVTSQWGQFEKENGRRTSDVSQQRHFASDKGFEFSALTIRDIKWGRT